MQHFLELKLLRLFLIKVGSRGFDFNKLKSHTIYSNIQCQHKFILYIHVILLRTLLLHTSIFSKCSITNFCILFLENKTLLTEVYPLYEYKWIFHSSPGPVIIKWSWFKQNSQVYIKLPPLSRERDLSLTLYQMASCTKFDYN